MRKGNGYYISKGAVIVGLVGIGMYGLNEHIEYSGWVLFFGLLSCL